MPYIKTCEHGVRPKRHCNTCRLNIARAGAVVYRKNHPDRIKIQKVADKKAHASRYKAYYLQWARANRDKCREKASRRRARRNANSVEPYSRAAIFKRDGGICHICRKPVGQDYHIDHLIPLSRGGADAPWNVAVAHRRCNFQRGAGRIPAQLRLKLPEAQG